MAPPELARNAPVADVLHPIEERLVPVFRYENDAAGVHGIEHLRRERLRFHEPLRGNQRLDDVAGAIALADCERVRLDLLEQAELFQIRDDALAGFEAVESGVRAGFGGHARILADHLDLRQLVALAGFEIVGIVRGRYLDDAGAELRIGNFVEDDRDFSIHQRQSRGLAPQVAVARVIRIHGERGVAEHRLRPRGGDDQRTGAAGQRISDVPQRALISSCFTSRSETRRLTTGAPVDHVGAAIDEPALVQANEGLKHGAARVRD